MNGSFSSGRRAIQSLQSEIKNLPRISMTRTSFDANLARAIIELCASKNYFLYGAYTRSGKAFFKRWKNRPDVQSDKYIIVRRSLSSAVVAIIITPRGDDCAGNDNYRGRALLLSLLHSPINNKSARDFLFPAPQCSFFVPMLQQRALSCRPRLVLCDSNCASATPRRILLRRFAAAFLAADGRILSTWGILRINVGPLSINLELQLQYKGRAFILLSSLSYRKLLLE